MKKHALTMIMLTVFLFILASAVKMDTSRAACSTSNTIYIRADGSIDPRDAPISSLDNMTYTLSTNILYTGDRTAILVERNNITIDGAGYTLQGMESGTGIDLTGRSSIKIKNITIKTFFNGIFLWYSNYNDISENTITANRMSGIRLFRFSNYNIIRGNNVSNNINGIGLVDSAGNHITENILKCNRLNIELYGSYGNFIHHNNFLKNASQIQVYTYNAKNVWDDGYPSGGNYWNDYNGTDLSNGQHQNVTGSDGISDFPLMITPPTTLPERREFDYYPLMGAYQSVKTYYGYSISFVSNSSITDLNFSVVDPQRALLTFNVRGNFETGGFCRVCIPKALINGSYVVVFDGEILTYPRVRELPCSNETHEYLYLTYFHCEHTIEIGGTTMIPENSSWTVIPLFAIATLLAAAIRRRKH